MTHAHNRTLLAQLGFSDPDRGMPEHDMACRYLGLPAQRQRIVDLVWKDAWVPTSSHWSGGRIDHLESSLTAVGSRLEETIYKGIGRYRSVVGFIDLSIRAEEYLVSQEFDHGKKKGEPERCKQHHNRHFMVEVKAKPVPAGLILRQLNLYRSFFDSPRDRPYAVAATIFPLSSPDRDFLRSQGVFTIRLGDPFKAWLAEQRALPATEADDEVF